MNLSDPDSRDTVSELAKHEDDGVAPPPSRDNLLPEPSQVPLRENDSVEAAPVQSVLE